MFALKLVIKLQDIFCNNREEYFVFTYPQKIILQSYNSKFLPIW